MPQALGRARGKGLIGALNYLAEKGLNAFSFLTYNAGGDGDQVWPFVQPVHERPAGLLWEWVEVRPGVVAMSDPMSIVSNIRIMEPGPEGEELPERILRLNRAVHGWAWQDAVRRAADTVSGGVTARRAGPQAAWPTLPAAA